jgi:hypothetical protein
LEGSLTDTRALGLPVKDLTQSVVACTPDVTVRATALRTVMVPAVATTGGSPAIETWIDYGTGFTRYLDVDDTAGVDGGVGGERSLTSGASFVKTIVLVQGRIGQQSAVPFATAGRYPPRTR